ncbi:hypothetical protein [Dyadobacter jiangsuensis]|uniref:Uncharacterized protein n=1 Tax=Dyadobacter jiangsuensis TaxID=1591085 RepID=A0A2P8FP60_9BACT|nr:hypothetical protein [Dyadobacter jiangsuensis]PSL23487.1 hypothetical protein CLV60_11642 [Dyadobacter jiangsuensis]
MSDTFNFDYNGHQIEVTYSTYPAERDVGIHGGAEIESVKLEYNGKFREIQTTDAFDDMILEQIDG